MGEREMLESIVLGTLLNEREGDGFFENNKASLRKELFSNRKNSFVFGIVERMHKDGCSDTTPYDVMRYCNENAIKYGNMVNFAVYMCELSENCAFGDLKKKVRELVKLFVKEKRNGK